VFFGDIARREVEALLSGHTDVAILFGAKGLELARSAHLHIVRRFGAREIQASPQLSGLVELRALTVDHPLLDGSPQVVTRIAGNLLKAASWAESFPKEALRQVAVEGKVEEADAAEAYDGLIAEGARLGLDAERRAEIAALAQWLKTRHLVPDDIDLDAWERPEVLEAARHGLKAVA
jgi:ABC-type nitrate/sulfonate/bicarbonate transport system substrate-binding protein